MSEEVRKARSGGWVDSAIMSSAASLVKDGRFGQSGGIRRRVSGAERSEDGRNMSEGLSQ